MLRLGKSVYADKYVVLTYVCVTVCLVPVAKSQSSEATSAIQKIANTSSSHENIQNVQENATATTTTTTTTTSTTTEKAPNIVLSITQRATTDNDNCPPLTGNMDHLTQDQFITKLTESCRYDKLIKPVIDNYPLRVTVQIDLTHIEAVEQLKFQTHMLMQYSYRDVRLRYDKLSPNRNIVLGQELLRDKIWVPHVILRNERDTSIMGSDGKDIFVSISPLGDVVYSYRMTATFYCWMNLQKFPFDSQLCNIVWSSWAYNTTNLRLYWERDRPVKIAPQLHLTEFVISETWTEEKDEPAPFENGGFVGDFSSLIFRFRLARQVGFYILDYFLPSVLLVMISWVTFWLQADAAPPRVTLGTSTMLAFITLSVGVTKNLPKVSYIKASEIWFLGCACFIFLSMAEFTFVNVIWRRKKKVELRKQTSKHILKGVLTPSLARKDLRKAESEGSLYRSRSCSNLESQNSRHVESQNYLTVHSAVNVPTITTSSQDELVGSQESVSTSIPVPDQGWPSPPPTWTTMTPHEVANWIDRKSRIVFPVAFLVFNLFYWSFVYAL